MVYDHRESIIDMPAKLSTTVNKIQLIPNSRNADTISEFYSYMKKSGVSQNHQNNSIKVVIAFAKFLGSDLTFYDIKNKEKGTDNSILGYKAKRPEMKWITTWNHYLHRIKLFFRWLHNCTSKEPDSETNPSSEWETPAFVKIKAKKTKRHSPYLETELWDSSLCFVPSEFCIFSWVILKPSRNLQIRRIASACKLVL